MVSSTSVPTQYKVTWDARTTSNSSGNPPAPNPRQQDISRASQRRLRSSCDGCRNSRVRCGGGSPCSRCRTREMDCTYGVSRRSGRLRASPIQDMPPTTSIATPSSTSSSTTAKTQQDLDLESTAAPKMVDSSDILNSSSQPDFGGLNDDAWLNFSTFAGASFQEDLNLFPNFTLDIPLAQLYDANQTSHSTVQNSNESICCPISSEPIINSTPTCSCLSSQFTCITTLVNLRDITAIGIDTILTTARQTSKILHSQINCTECNKGTWSFVLTMIILQRLLYIFCGLATCRLIDVKSKRLGVGTYQLSEEEDLAHKKMLTLSSMKEIEDFVTQFTEAVNKFLSLTETMKYQCKTPLKTDCANLQWAADGLNYITTRFQAIRKLIEAEDWRR